MNKKKSKADDRDIHTIVEISPKRVLSNSPVYVEIRSDFYDEERRAIAIDTWETMDDDEEGQVVAYVYDNGKVEWINQIASLDQKVKDEIELVLKQHK